MHHATHLRVLLRCPQTVESGAARDALSVTPINHPPFDQADFGLLARLALLVTICFTGLLFPPPAFAGTMANDPKGFHGIPWESSLAESPGLTLAEPGERIDGYDLNAGPLPLGEAKVDSIRFFTVDGKFARVTVRYRGKKIHAQVLAYLQSLFGPIDQTPGQTMSGFNQQFNWRGSDTEINLTYENQGERGFVFFESRALAPIFIESLGGQ